MEDHAEEVDFCAVVGLGGKEVVGGVGDAARYVVGAVGEGLVDGFDNFREVLDDEIELFKLLCKGLRGMSS